MTAADDDCDSQFDNQFEDEEEKITVCVRSVLEHLYWLNARVTAGT